MSQFTPSDTPYFSCDELKRVGFASVGENCRISRKCSFYEIKGEIGSNVRIDDFCIIKGYVIFRSYIHIGAFSLISGVGDNVCLDDCTTLSSGVHVYSASDDYSAAALSSTSVPKEFTVTRKGPVRFRTGALVGAHSLILPNSKIGVGASIGAHCIIYGSIPDGAVVTNRAAIGRVVKYRSTERILEMARRLISAPPITRG